MKKSACIIPIKTYSSRLSQKNFRLLGDKSLYKYLIESIVKANCFDRIYLDSDSEIIKDYANDCGLGFIQRKPELAKGSAGGNDLIEYYREIIPEYYYYFQAHVTSPFLKPESIRICHDILTGINEYNSVLTVMDVKKFLWHQFKPVNYDPKILPRTQELEPVHEETSGLYGITAKEFDRNRCRIGSKPYFYIVDEKEAVDIDTIEDFKYAEYLLHRDIKI